ncbi:Holliday junction resolvase RuvX [Fuerstiella marisgermanici]|uniref:Putative pre-16S rRNA nuclease n=1 Tax=Fuerstiella marisgermanici TaxID=1891926 RepID=A0A1P8WS55_9PLAN|nr:Holliday junction resolvase RuvX [Fuerstiella marisgermanici]APZ96887.1 Putative Holliday junction resolvase [Fuerstiella marisgermanici]
MQPIATDNSNLPARGRLLGIDYGTKRVGVAVSDVFQEISSPLYNYERRGQLNDEAFFLKVVEEYETIGFVIGLPVHMSGDESQKSKEARRYAKWLTKLTGLPHAFQDERYSSVQAEAKMFDAQLSKKQRHARIDKLAAQILLQAFIEARAAEAAKQGTDD